MIGTFPILTMIIDKFVTNSRTWQGSLSLTILLVLHILKTLTWQGSLSTTMPSCSARLYTFIRYSTPSLSSENHYCDYWLSNTKIYFHDDDLSKASKHHPVLLAILTVVYLAMLIYLKKKDLESERNCELDVFIFVIQVLHKIFETPLVFLLDFELVLLHSLALGTFVNW